MCLCFEHDRQAGGELIECLGIEKHASMQWGHASQEAKADISAMVFLP